MKDSNNQLVFFELLRAGLWEHKGFHFPSPNIDYSCVYKYAQGQSVVGLVTAGIEIHKELKVPKDYSLMFVGSALQIERTNVAMDSFLTDLIRRLKEESLEPILVKGQGIAQCYERPLWRSSGDIDLLLPPSEYERYKSYFSNISREILPEDIKKMHIGYLIEDWEVELHGSLHGGWSKRVDNELDIIQKELFDKKNFRVWRNKGIDIFLANPNTDVIFVFCHIVQHFFTGGIGLRQICDWCRILWVYKDALDRHLLECRLQMMNLMDKWKVFATLSVKWLGMPYEAMPFIESNRKYERKADRVLSLVMDTGNFGHNRDLSYKQKYPHIIGLLISAWRHTRDGVLQLFIFPKDSVGAWWRMMMSGLRSIEGDSFIIKFK